MRDRISPRAFGLAVAFAALAWGWVATTPALMMGLNWDAGNYAAVYASRQGGWSLDPWSSHLGIGHVYFAAVAITRAAGGTAIQGFRLLGALMLAGAAAAIASAAFRIGRSAPIAALVAAAYVTAWGVMILVMTVEDNVLYLPAAAATIALGLLRIDGWRARDSVCAGGLVGFGILMSWQAGLYLFSPLYVAAVLGGPGRSGAVRARDVALLVAMPAAVVVLWAAFVAATSAHTFGHLIDLVRAGPQPNFLPRTWADLRNVLAQPGVLALHSGYGVVHEIGAALVERPAVKNGLVSIGAALLGATAVAAIGGAVWWLRGSHAADDAGRTTRARLHFVTLTLAALTFTTAFYVDLPADKYKRYDFLPLLIAALVIAALPVLTASPARRRALMAALGLLVAAQTSIAWARARTYRALIPTATAKNYNGRGDETWYQYMARLRREHPRACRFVFDFLGDDLHHGRWQQEISASLWSELPDHLVVGPPPVIAGWRHPVRAAAAADARRTLRPCDWISPAARAAIERP